MTEECQNLLEQFYLQFLIWFSFAASIAIWNAHKYLLEKLGDKHDKGYLFMAGAFASWGFMAFAELYIKDPSTQINVRTLFSILNNALLVMSFSFIDHGWKKLSNRIQAFGLVWVAIIIGTITLVVGKLPIEEDWFPITDALFSVFILSVFSVGLFVVFQKRGMVPMSFLSAITWLLFVITQIYVLIKGPTPSLEWENFKDLIENTIAGELIRILSRPMLLICILQLALSWLGVGGRSDSKATTLSGSAKPTTPPSQIAPKFENRLEFQVENGKVVILLWFDDKKGTHVENLELKMINPVPRKNLLILAKASQGNGTKNLGFDIHKEKKTLMENINKNIDGKKIDWKDFYQKRGGGHALRFNPDKVVIGDEVETLV